jgi:hypothetical protein
MHSSPFLHPWERLDTLEFNLSLKLFFSHWLTFCFFLPSNLNSYLSNFAKSPFLIRLRFLYSLVENLTVQLVSSLLYQRSELGLHFSILYVPFFLLFTTHFIFLFWTFWTPSCHPLPSAEVILMTSNFYHDVIFH